MSRCITVLLLLLAVATTAPGRAAQDDEATDEEGAAAEATAAAGKVPKRAVPNYDGRGSRPPTPAESARWVPRILLAPLFLLHEGVIAQPGWAIGTAAERNRTPPKVANALTFGTGDRAGFYPTAFYDFGFRPSFGLTMWARPVRPNDGRLKAHLGFGGRRWWCVELSQRLYLGSRTTHDLPFDKSQIHMAFRFYERPDHAFHGLGPDPSAERSWYFRRQIGGTVSSEIVFGDYDGVGVGITLDDNHFAEGSPTERSGELSIEQQFDVTDPDVVPGFGGYTLGMAHAALNLDSRKPRPAGGSGVRLEVGGEIGKDLREGGGAFVRYGGEVGLHLDVSGGRNRVLSLRHKIRLAAPIGEATSLPFTELPAIGGDEVLRGFPEGRYRGYSLWASSLQYTWPAWVYLDSIVFVDVGNTFGRNLSGLGMGQLCGSFGFGLRSSFDRDSSVHLLIAAGTTPFDDPKFRINSFRLSIGAGRGF